MKAGDVPRWRLDRDGPGQAAFFCDETLNIPKNQSLFPDICRSWALAFSTAFRLVGQAKPSGRLCGQPSGRPSGQCRQGRPASRANWSIPALGGGWSSVRTARQQGSKGLSGSATHGEGSTCEEQRRRSRNDEKHFRGRKEQHCYVGLPFLARALERACASTFGLRWEGRRMLPASRHICLEKKKRKETQYHNRSGRPGCI